MARRSEMQAEPRTAYSASDTVREGVVGFTRRFGMLLTGDFRLQERRANAYARI